MTVPDGDLLVVGYIRKPHGLKGELVVRLSTNREERLEAGSQLVADEQVLTVKASRPNAGDHLVTFVGVDSREKADPLRGKELRAEPIDDPDELWVHDLVGRSVIDQDGIDRGTVVEVQVNPASDLLVLDSDHLVPVVFVVDIEPETIRVEAPAGLFDL